MPQLYAMKKEDTHKKGFIIPVKGSHSYRRILRKAKEGEIIKVRNGVYATLDTLAGGMIEIDTIVPGGILCLYSAWHHYGMTTQIPDSYYVAIGRKRRVRLPEAIDITLIYQKDELLEIGRSKTNIEGFELSIYDRERCLCDAIKYRNKIGIDVMAEILNSYLSYPKKNLSLLLQYAKQLRVYNLLSTYLYVKI